MFALAIDIGYSNLKLAYGCTEKGKPTTQTLPAGSAPAEYLSQGIPGGAGGHSGFDVDVGGTSYVAGVPKSRIEGYNRVLSAEYPFSDDYLALFYAGLLTTERDQNDLVVTGLPIDQALDDQTRERLEERLTGEHEVYPGHSVIVKKVKVLPQPIGAYVDFVHSYEDPDIISESRVLVIDPGFFSVDTCVIDNGAFDRKSAHSSQEAMSAVLEEAGQKVEDELGRPFDLATLEDSTRRDCRIPVYGEKKDLGAYMQYAAANVAENVMRSIDQAMRRSKVPGADFIVVAGGGANYYVDAAKNNMKRSKVVSPKDPVASVVRGFFEVARG